MDKFEGLVVTSKEDQVLLGDRESSLIPNGVDLPRSYVSSAGRRDILFVGPFRSLNNWLAIEAFLEQSFPRIQEGVSDAHITIIGGAGAKQRVAGVSCFSPHSIRVLEFVEDLDPVFVECALTINPQLEQRGSSLKVVQSLAAGRVCVTTRVGARGATTAGFKGLVVVDDFVEFSHVIIRLLLDEPYRLSIETPELAKLNEFSWEKAGLEFVEYVEKIIRRSPQATRRARRNRSCALL
jgi:glycosyltransferase involved in cell wall biosynthesis